MALQLLKKDRAVDPVIDDLTGADDEEAFNRIRCPRCGWRPSASSRWSCISLGSPEPPFDGCWTVWNTFATGGRCPGCQHQWRWTSCHRCEEWSRHVDWYETRSA